ncbi:LssY C-terminal domain-containing protein [Cupriavidus sp. IK-TO18]|uniref:LssY C-terminal domain-containing protein n=1 Tax=Cupriavidus sp. IK-TO18 TaxID=2782182 RepID=UPI001898BAE2|nr:LssY C-terminal domain-containing protein [Cupriavidus sp. IK-TO18]MBF6991991.1 LssY C-terminal domain-containing protein [Cupriavidus sp. IK-TO18]
MRVARHLRTAFRRGAGTACLLLALGGCATWQAPPDAGDGPLRERAIGTINRDVRVSATVLGKEDSKRMLGTDVTRIGVQPVWVEVHNGMAQPLWLLRSGTDPDYFSPLEVAWSVHTLLDGTTNSHIDAHFNRLGFRNPIPPGQTRAGLLFTNPDYETKFVNIDLFGDDTLIPFALYLQVPDDDASTAVSRSPLSFRYPESDIRNYTDLASLRAALEAMPACATAASGTVPGDPLNAVIVGDINDISSAAVRRNYRRNLRQADLPQQVFGRQPDVVIRKVAQAGAPAIWVRGWLTPVRFQGQPVFVAQVGRPVGGRFARADEPSVRLQSDVDEARNLFVQDMMYSGGLEQLGFVHGVGAASQQHPRPTMGGATYRTDGLRAVLFFATRPLSLSDVQFLDWEPYLEQRERFQSGASEDAARHAEH